MIFHDFMICSHADNNINGFKTVCCKYTSKIILKLHYKSYSTLIYFFNYTTKKKLAKLLNKFISFNWKACF